MEVDPIVGPYMLETFAGHGAKHALTVRRLAYLGTASAYGISRATVRGFGSCYWRTLSGFSLAGVRSTGRSWSTLRIICRGSSFRGGLWLGRFQDTTILTDPVWSDVKRAKKIDGVKETDGQTFDGKPSPGSLSRLWR